MLGLLGSILPAVLNKILPADPAKAMELQNEITKELIKHEQLQLEINKEEAKSDNIFVSGWRPATAWIGVFGFLYSIALQPIISYFLSIYGHQPLPILDTEVLNTVLFGLLGLGGFRSLEKIKR